MKNYKDDEDIVEISVTNESVEKLDENNYDGYCEWIRIKGDTYVPSTKVDIQQEVKPGVYKLGYNGQYNEEIFIKHNLNLDELLWLPDPIFDTIINDIEYFWDNEDKFRKYKFTYKRGILLHGKPGCGKSSICLLLAQKIVKKNGIVVYINNGDDLHTFNSLIPKFRKIQPNTPILCVLEDLDGLLHYKDNETSLLNLLDGANQLNNIVYIGNTNYPENLKERITNRPSRFDRRYKIDLPNEEIRRFYLENKISNDDKDEIDLEYLIHKTEGLTLAHLGEIVKSILIFNKDIDESIKEVKSMGEYISSSQYNIKKNVGFSK